MRPVVLTAEESAAISEWSENSQRRAVEVLSQYPEKRSAVMPLLYISMIENQYVTEEGMRQVGLLTGLSPAQVQSIASFYTMYKRQPVGRYLVGVCTSISCFLLGADEVLAAIDDVLEGPGRVEITAPQQGHDLAPGETRWLDLDLEPPPSGIVQGTATINARPARGGRWADG